MKEKLIKAFTDGFSVGFTEGKTRNIITEKYYSQVFKKALTEFEKTLNENN